MDTDVALNKLESLLHTIAKLYSGVFATILQERVTSYHAETASGYDDDIGEALRTYIKQVKHEAANARKGGTDPALPAESAAEHGNRLTQDGSGDHIDNPLSDYFKKTSNFSELASPLGQKLKTSAWDHTHTAIRLAHQGDYASAKLHADLANNAIHELAHFMPAEDFVAFKRAVKAELTAKS